jgi:hypothetical protein|tara:strand:- start:2555 stop:2848 length:294 start_codon:yes stop_codon:yes gene_type:complete
MAVAQVSLISAVKAAPVRANAGARRSTRAVHVVAKAGGVQRVSVAKKAAPVALAVGTCFPDRVGVFAAIARSTCRSRRLPPSAWWGGSRDRAASVDR